MPTDNSREGSKTNKHPKDVCAQRYGLIAPSPMNGLAQVRFPRGRHLDVDAVLARSLRRVAGE
jgi:hypothetical protein